MTTSHDLQWGRGPHLVEASAGTGKTTWMVRTAVRMLVGDPEVPRVGGPKRLLAVTFTRAATAQLMERLREQVHRLRQLASGATPREGEQWAMALLDRCGPVAGRKLDDLNGTLDQLQVSTIHSFCAGVLEEFPLECGVAPDLGFIDDIDVYKEEAVRDEWRARTWVPTHVPAHLQQGSLEDCIDAIRGAVGAERPDRTALERAATEADQAHREAWAALAETLDEARLREWWGAVQWSRSKSSEAPTETDVTDLLNAVATFKDEGACDASLLCWTPQAIGKWALKKSREMALAEPFVALCGEVERTREHGEEIRGHLIGLDALDRLESALARDRVAGFDDMIAFVERAVTDPESGPPLRSAIGARYDAVLIDEFQDTDWAQWRIFHTLFSEHPLVLVGDPKQAIYGFRNADITAYNDARDRTAATPGRIMALETNYRSDPGLVAALTALYQHAPEPFKVPEARLAYEPVRAHRSEATLADPSGRPLMIWDLGTASKEALADAVGERIVQEIRRLLNSPHITAATPDGGRRRIQPGDMAILVPKHELGSGLLGALRRAGVPAVASRTGDISASATWTEMTHILRAIDQPSHTGRVRRARATMMAGGSAAQLYAVARDESQWRVLIGQLDEVRTRWARRSALPALLGLLTEWGAIQRMSTHVDGERRLTDLRHLLEILQRAEREGARTPAQMLAWMDRFAEQPGNTAEARQLHLESSRDAVTVSTVHAAKGLEWPIVFCPFLWHQHVPGERMPRVARFAGGVRRVVFDRMPLAGELPADTAEEESMRLCYVALTRAQWRVYTCTGHGSRDHPDRLAPIWHLLRDFPDGAEGLAAASPDLVGTTLDLEVDVDGLERVRDVPETDVPLAARPISLSAGQRTSWRVSSYSAVSKPLKIWAPASPGGIASPAGPPGHGIAPEPIPVATAEEADRLDDAEVEGPFGPTLQDRALPAGAHTGDALHLLFERFDYERVNDEAELEREISDVLDRFALPRVGASTADRDACAEVIRRMVRATLLRPIPGCVEPLHSVSMDRSIREWRFTMPMAGLSVVTMAQAFRNHGGAAWLAIDYAGAPHPLPCHRHGWIHDGDH
jgi:exodeoxyribonuclease V beta subunit